MYRYIGFEDKSELDVDHDPSTLLRLKLQLYLYASICFAIESPVRTVQGTLTFRRGGTGKPVNRIKHGKGLSKDA